MLGNGSVNCTYKLIMKHTSDHQGDLSHQWQHVHAYVHDHVYVDCRQSVIFQGIKMIDLCRSSTSGFLVHRSTEGLRKVQDRNDPKLYCLNTQGGTSMI